MSRPLDNMTDCRDAKRLLILWVPRWAAKWKRVSWAVCLGRLWFQTTPDFNSLDTPNAQGEHIDPLDERQTKNTSRSI